jgi:hypothetical protein
MPAIQQEGQENVFVIQMKINRSILNNCHSGLSGIFLRVCSSNIKKDSEQVGMT